MEQGGASLSFLSPRIGLEACQAGLGSFTEQGCWEASEQRAVLSMHCPNCWHACQQGQALTHLSRGPTATLAQVVWVLESGLEKGLTCPLTVCTCFALLSLLPFLSKMGHEQH